MEWTVKRRDSLRESIEGRLPWWIASGAFLIYIVFLQRYATFEGLAALVKLNRWDWHINLIAPLHQIVTYPLRWLPSVLQLWTLNATAAAFAAAALGLLARSVCLMPNDPARFQQTGPLREWNLWLPAVFAALICGLQLSFWENAVVSTGETFDLMIFAWLVNQLLEYRRERKPRRLYWFAFVYGLAIVNNYAMIALFPAFLTASLLIIDRASRRWGLFFRVVCSGVAGLVLYTFLPALIASPLPDEPNFWILLRRQWEFQLAGLSTVPRYVFLISSLTSLIPLAFIGMVSFSSKRRRRTTAFGQIVQAAANVLFHFIFLVACIAAAFDPIFGTRYLVKERVAALPLYFLGALAIGYFIEFFLHRLASSPPPQPGQLPSQLNAAARRTAIWGLSATAAVTALALAVRTLSRVSGDSARGVTELSRAMAASLPDDGAVVLSDDLFQLYSVQYELRKKSPRNRSAFVHTGSLLSPEYHRYLSKTQPERWPRFVRPPDLTLAIDAPNLMNALLQVDQKSSIYYLHPSFGLFFEFFEARPQGMVYRMVRSPTNALSGGVMSLAEVERQHTYLQERLAGQIERLAAKAQNFEPGQASGDGSVNRTRPMTEYLRTTSSRALNHFGVEVQRAGNLERAAACFDLALKSNPANVAAFINQQHNAHLRTGKTDPGLQAELRSRLEPYDNRWETILKLHGPFDEPISCHHLAKTFTDSGLFRQAGRELERVSFFSPDNRSAQLDHAMMCIRSGMTGQAETAAAAYRHRFDHGNLESKETLELVRVQAWAEALRKNIEGAEHILRAALEKDPTESMAWDTLVEIYLRFRRESDAVKVMEERLQTQPDDVAALVNFGGLKMRVGRFAEALQTTERALSIEPRNEDARFNRALIYTAMSRWDAAQRDFQFLLEKTAARRRIQSLYGLAGVYFLRSNHADSLSCYKEFLKDTAPSEPPTFEIQTARSRVRMLEKQLDYERLAEPGYVIPGTGQLRH